jgi:hypothetical protein
LLYVQRTNSAAAGNMDNRCLGTSRNWAKTGENIFAKERVSAARTAAEIRSHLNSSWPSVASAVTRSRHGRAFDPAIQCRHHSNADPDCTTAWMPDFAFGELGPAMTMGVMRSARLQERRWGGSPLFCPTRARRFLGLHLDRGGEVAADAVAADDEGGLISLRSDPPFPACGRTSPHGLRANAKSRAPVWGRKGGFTRRRRGAERFGQTAESTFMHPYGILGMRRVQGGGAMLPLGSADFGIVYLTYEMYHNLQRQTSSRPWPRPTALMLPAG